MKIGVTGTRNGMSEIQENKFKTILTNGIKFLYPPLLSDEFHHGDCVGADVQAAQIAKNIGYRIICHPPIVTELRGYFLSDDYRPPLTYFQRNRNIVDEIDFLFVLPMDNEPKEKGGTWYTFNYALRRNKPVMIIYPEGNSVYYHNPTKEPTLDEIL